MQSIAKLRYVRLTPRKARLVADLVRNKPALEALDLLSFTNKKAAHYIEKTLRSAIANAVNNNGMNEEKLFISKIMVDEGPVLKRIQPRAMGRADVIRKKLSHITIMVEEAAENNAAAVEE